MIVVGNYDGILKGKKLHAEPNTNVFKDQEEAVKFGTDLYGKGNFGIYKLCSNCGESFYTKIKDVTYTSMYKVIKAVKIIGKIIIS